MLHPRGTAVVLRRAKIAYSGYLNLHYYLSCPLTLPYMALADLCAE